LRSRSRWLVHVDVAATVDGHLRGQPRASPRFRELEADGRAAAGASRAPQAGPAAANGRQTAALERTPAPGDPLPCLIAAARPDRLARATAGAICQINAAASSDADLLLRCSSFPAAGAGRRAAVSSCRCSAVCDPEAGRGSAHLRLQLGRDPEVRRRPSAIACRSWYQRPTPLPQVDAGLSGCCAVVRSCRQGGSPLGEIGPRAGRGGMGPVPGPQDESEAIKECRLAVEQVVLPIRRPVERLPRSPGCGGFRRRRCSGCGPYASAEFACDQQRLRVFPPLKGQKRRFASARRRRGD